MESLGKKIKNIMNLNHKNAKLVCFIVVCFFLLGSYHTFAQPNISMPNIELTIDGAKG